MILEKAKREALEILLSVPEHPDAEISIAGIDDPEVWLGMGWLVGKGYAVYRGSYDFRVTDLGRAESKEFLT